MLLLNAFVLQIPNCVHVPFNQQSAVLLLADLSPVVWLNPFLHVKLRF